MAPSQIRTDRFCLPLIMQETVTIYWKDVEKKPTIYPYKDVTIQNGMIRIEGIKKPNNAICIPVENIQTMEVSDKDKLVML